MTEQLKVRLIVHAASIFTKSPKVNGLEAGSALWSAKPSDWICSEKSISLWIKKAPLWSGQEKKRLFIMSSGDCP